MTDYGGSKTPKNERDYWQTPIEIFNALDREFGFWLDAAASERTRYALTISLSWMTR